MIRWAGGVGTEECKAGGIRAVSWADWFVYGSQCRGGYGDERQVMVDGAELRQNRGKSKAGNEEEAEARPHSQNGKNHGFATPKEDDHGGDC